MNEEEKTTKGFRKLIKKAGLLDTKFSDDKIQLKPATIKCEKCKEESLISLWQVGLSNEGELIRVCPLCHETIEI